MFMGSHASARRGLTPQSRLPEHAIELGWVWLTPPYGPSIGAVRHRQTAA